MRNVGGPEPIHQCGRSPFVMHKPSLNVRTSAYRLSTVATSTRQTHKTDFGEIMRTGLLRAGQVATEGLQVAAPFIPAGAIVSAALASAHRAAGLAAGQGPGAAGFAATGSVAAGLSGSGLSGSGLSGSGLSASGAAGLSGSGAAGLSASGAAGLSGSGAAGLSGSGAAGLSGSGAAGLSASGAAGLIASGRGGGYFGASALPSGVAPPGDLGASAAFNEMMMATQRMAEFNASFNLQYLQLQQRIQVDTRQFNLISNIMKSKHDAAKNALNNVR